MHPSHATGSAVQGKRQFIAGTRPEVLFHIMYYFAAGCQNYRLRRDPNGHRVVGTACNSLSPKRSVGWKSLRRSGFA
jgi:hypothetical protein